MATNPNVARVRAHYRAKAIALQSEEVYLRYMKYLNGCAQLFRDGYTDVHQITLRKTASDSQRPSVFIASPHWWKPPPKYRSHHWTPAREKQYGTLPERMIRGRMIAISARRLPR